MDNNWKNEDVEWEKVYHNYGRRIIDDYRHRLAVELANDGLSQDDINEHPEYMSYIKNYVDTEIINKKTRHDIEGLSYRLANSVLGEYSKSEESSRKIYPVVNVYKGHNLQYTIYFRLTGDKTIETSTVNVYQSSLII